MNKGTPIDRLGIWLTTDLRVKRKFRFIPGLLAPRWRRLYAPVYGAWGSFTKTTPRGLQGVAGIGRDPQAEQKAFEEGPLPSMLKIYPNAHHQVRAGMWHAALPTAPRLMRAFAAIERAARRPPADVQVRLEPEELTARVREKAAELGLSAIGVAQYDPKYTFEPYLGTEVGDRMVVCALEQNYASTQQIPSPTGERAALSAYAEGMQMTAALAEFLQDLGYRAEAHSAEGRGVMIHYGVASGLGQLGLNGQLLTPFAGSRCRLLGISTDAPLVFDTPKDYGINKICDECRVCQRRCPANAIPVGGRRLHRGVEKAKINIHRCLPVMAAADGCAVCTKVCPVQRFGLAAVYEEYERSGEILGKGTDDLEAFHWPPDGRTYQIGKRPKVPQQVFFKLDGQ